VGSRSLLPIVIWSSKTLPVVLALALLGCARKAPGPKECQDFAIAVSGARTLRELSVPAVRDTVDSMTVECLVTPYDRALLRCVKESGRLRACKLEFDRRRARRALQEN
jgi:hypothetical protein